MTEISLFEGDITQLDIDVIVNAANNSLLGGGGVDGAIHKAAGSDLLKECSLLNGCETGQAKITKGYLLKSKYIIHTVGPIWEGGLKNEDFYLKKCYINSLQLAIENNLQSIAFPCISSGVFGYPKQRAAIIAVHAITSFAKENPHFKRIVFSVIDDENISIYKKLLR